MPRIQRAEPLYRRRGDLSRLASGRDRAIACEHVLPPGRLSPPAPRGCSSTCQQVPHVEDVSRRSRRSSKGCRGRRLTERWPPAGLERKHTKTSKGLVSSNVESNSSALALRIETEKRDVEPSRVQELARLADSQARAGRREGFEVQPPTPRCLPSIPIVVGISVSIDEERMGKRDRGMAVVDGAGWRRSPGPKDHPAILLDRELDGASNIEGRRVRRIVPSSRLYDGAVDDGDELFGARPSTSGGRTGALPGGVEETRGAIVRLERLDTRLCVCDVSHLPARRFSGSLWGGARRRREKTCSCDRPEGVLPNAGSRIGGIGDTFEVRSPSNRFALPSRRGAEAAWPPR